MQALPACPKNLTDTPEIPGGFNEPAWQPLAEMLASNRCIQKACWQRTKPKSQRHDQVGSAKKSYRAEQSGQCQGPCLPSVLPQHAALTLSPRLPARLLGTYRTPQRPDTTLTPSPSRQLMTKQNQDPKTETGIGTENERDNPRTALMA